MTVVATASHKHSALVVCRHTLTEYILTHIKVTETPGYRSASRCTSTYPPIWCARDRAQYRRS